MKDKQESVIEFPCEFPIKAMGLSHPEFDVRIVSIIRKHIPDIHEGAVTSRRSRQGKYTSITVIVWATSQAQVDSIYQDLTDCRDVLMAL